MSALGLSEGSSLDFAKLGFYVTWTSSLLKTLSFYGSYSLSSFLGQIWWRFKMVISP